MVAGKNAGNVLRDTSMLISMSVSTHSSPVPPSERWLSALAEIGEAVGGEQPVTDLLDRVARTACTLLDYDFCAVFLPAHGGAALTIVGSHGLSPEYVAQVNADRPILLDVRGDQEAPTSLAFRTGEVVALGDIEQVPGFGWGGVAHEQGYRALISVPLRRGAEVIGALNGYRAEPHQFDRAEIGLVSTLASQVAIALGTAQLRAQEQATIRELRRAEEVHTLLTATALRGEGVTGVCAALAELLGQGVLIEDVYGETLAAAHWPGIDREPTPVEVDEQLRAGTVVSVRSRGPAVAGVLLDAAVVARIHVDAPRAELSGLDVRAVEQAAVVTALELLRARTAAEVEQRLRGSLVADLLAVDDAALPELLDRARRLGWDLSGRQTLVVLRSPAAKLTDTRTDRVLAVADRVVSALAARPLAASYRGDVVLVCSDRSPHVSPADIAGRLVDTLRRAGVVDYAVAAVSRPASARELPAAFRTVRGALGLAAEQRTSTVMDLGDVTIDHLLLQLDEPDRLREFACAVLGPAIEYDRKRSTELLHTARVFVDHDLDRRAAAGVLHLHVNTVAQRIRRLEELTGLRLSRPKDLLELTAALRVARIAGVG